jgi:hypothetical protein
MLDKRLKRVPSLDCRRVQDLTFHQVRVPFGNSSLFFSGRSKALDRVYGISHTNIQLYIYVIFYFPQGLCVFCLLPPHSLTHPYAEAMRLSTGLVALAASVPALVRATTAQKPDLVLPADAADSADKVRAIFLDSYDAYKYVSNIYITFILQYSYDTRKYAWGHDDLTPLSKSFYDGRNGWGASIVDAMTTLVCLLFLYTLRRY